MAARSRSQKSLLDADGFAKNVSKGFTSPNSLTDDFTVNIIEFHKNCSSKYYMRGKCIGVYVQAKLNRNELEGRADRNANSTSVYAKHHKLFTYSLGHRT